MVHTKLGKVGLLLSGGGSHGFAHIGVLKAMKNLGIAPDYLVGCSIGSLMGVFYAAGKTPKEIEFFFFKKHPYAYFDPVINKSGILKGEKIVSLSLEFLKVKKFSDLKIPVFINSMNVNTGEEKIFKSGSLATALTASMAFPGVFVPKKINGKLFVDGGVFSPVPVHLMPKVDTLIIVDVSRVHNNITDSSSAINVLEQSVLLMQRRLVEYDIKEYVKDTKLILIKPPVQKYGFFEVRKTSMEKMLKLGFKTAKKILKSELKNNTII